MEITIGKTKYHVCFRIIVRCQIRTCDALHMTVAQGESICMPQDRFDERDGKRRAFDDAMTALTYNLEMRYNINTKDKRRAIWEHFLAWLDGKPKPKPAHSADEIVAAIEPVLLNQESPLPESPACTCKMAGNVRLETGAECAFRGDEEPF